MKDRIWDCISSINLSVLWFDMIVAIGGPKTNQHINAKNKSFNKTKIVLYFLCKEFNLVPIKFIVLIFNHQESLGSLYASLSFEEETLKFPKSLHRINFNRFTLIITLKRELGR